METEIAIIGSGPAGLSAAIAAVQTGANVTVLDENGTPGGQLVKQIHKSFGGKNHFAGMRGFNIGKRLYKEAIDLGANVRLDTVVWGLFPDSTLGIVRKERLHSLHYRKLLIAAGASEKVFHFPGWTLPGVMGAGAVQTLMNVHRILPGKKILVIGTGNMGLIVAYQLLQAGASVTMVEALPQIGGYHVHADKIRRAGVPIYLSHWIREALGRECVEGAVLHCVDGVSRPLPNTEWAIDVDVVCLAVGLAPQVELLRQTGCTMRYSEVLGGFLPLHSPFMQTTNPHIYVAGDCAGIGETSSAMEEGRIAGLTMAESLGYRSRSINRLRREALERLRNVRKGPFGEPIHKAKTEVVRHFERAVK